MLPAMFGVRLLGWQCCLSPVASCVRSQWGNVSLCPCPCQPQRRITMLPRCAVRVCHVLVLVLCLSAAEDFDWTKNDRGSFYYGTFPSGNVPPTVSVCNRGNVPPTGKSSLNYSLSVGVCNRGNVSPTGSSLNYSLSVGVCNRGNVPPTGSSLNYSLSVGVCNSVNVTYSLSVCVCNRGNVT